MAAGIKVVEKTKGEKIPYVVNSKHVINFDDELSLNLPKYERDYGVLLDVCKDSYGMLVMGRGVSYVAQVEIPERQYIEKEVDNPDYDPEDPMSNEKTTEREPVPFDITKCTLYLWGLDPIGYENPEEVE